MSIKSKLHEIKESFKGKKMAPAFNAFHTFLFTPNDITSSGTHVKVADDLKRTMNTVKNNEYCYHVISSMFNFRNF